MRKTLSSTEWLQELEEFARASEITPPAALTEKIRGRVRRDLNPSLGQVFLKLVLIHAVVGGLTLLVCPQFGFVPLRGTGLAGVLMGFGPRACLFGCGIVFMTGSLLAAGLFLRPEELRMVRRTGALQIVALALLSIGLFICSGSEIVAGLAVFWTLGSLLGGLGGLELGCILRPLVRRLLKTRYVQ